MNCPHRRLMADRDPDYRYCMDCFQTIFVGEAMGKPEKVSRPVTRGEARASDRVKR